MSEAGPFLDVIGFPKEGEHVPPTGRAEAILIAQGWTKPDEAVCVICGSPVADTRAADGFIELHWDCERPLLEDSAS